MKCRLRNEQTAHSQPTEIPDGWKSDKIKSFTLLRNINNARALCFESCHRSPPIEDNRSIQQLTKQVLLDFRSMISNFGLDDVPNCSLKSIFLLQIEFSRECTVIGSQ